MIEGYKNTAVGVIPNDWEVKSIGSQIELLTGFPFKSNDYSKDGDELFVLNLNPEAFGTDRNFNSIHTYCCFANCLAQRTKINRPKENPSLSSKY